MCSKNIKNTVNISIVLLLLVPFILSMPRESKISREFSKISPKIEKDSEILTESPIKLVNGAEFELFSAPTRKPHKIKNFDLLNSNPTILPEDLIYGTEKTFENMIDDGGSAIIIDPDSSELHIPNNHFLDSYETELDSKEEEIRKTFCPDNKDTEETKSISKNVPSRMIFDKIEKKCGIVGTKSHCGQHMIFLYENSTAFGYCECDSSKSKIPLVYHEETKNCYPIYQQAYCPSNKEWLTFTKEGVPICSKRTCAVHNYRKSKLLVEVMEVPLNGTGPCVKLHQPSIHCNDLIGETVLFLANEIRPKCGLVKRTPTPRIISPFRQKGCRPGSYLSISGKCQPRFIW